MSGRNRLSGHTLAREGAGHASPGCCSFTLGLGRGGHGLCSCGAKSDHLDSDYARRRWHREHKDEIRAAS